MLKEIYQVTAGGLLHDLGKVIYRADNLDGRAHPISGYEALRTIMPEQTEVLQCVRYHHKRDIAQSDLANNDLAFAVYVADNIASGADRRKLEDDAAKGFDKLLPLDSIYNLMNNNTAHLVHRQGALDMADGTINLPVNDTQLYNSSKYSSLYHDLSVGLKQIVDEPDYLDSLLALLESYLIYVPSSTNKQEAADISLYDHSKITAAAASCIYQYLTAQSRTNFRQELLIDEKQFLAEPAFLMFSCDLSGIQSFIYTTSDEGALKSLRARSLYLEILLEHIMDEILQKVGLSRANLIYTGGGHAYVLLANTKQTKEQLQAAQKQLKQWFITHFDSDLYLAMAWQPCSANDLMNQNPTQTDAYAQIFSELSRQLGAQKISRYSAEDLLWLNNASLENAQRECKECHRSMALSPEGFCAFCDNIKSISSEFIKGDGYFSILPEPLPGHSALPLPGLNRQALWLQMLDKQTVQQNLNTGQIVRFYSKNQMVTGKTLATRIWMGDYHVRQANSVASFEHLADNGQGINRIGVLRADVDNLGQAFSRGFRRDNEPIPNKYATLSRSATFSRSLSLFFKYHLNGILSGTNPRPIEPFSLDGTPKDAPRQVNIIYSGGDDLFLVGAWQDIIECAVDIEKTFALYTQETLTLSAGIGIFPPHYPLLNMARVVGRLEDDAKRLDDTKCAIALFGEKKAHCYHWRQFEEEVVGVKLRFLQKHLGTKQLDEQTCTAFLYQILALLRHPDEKINLARFAYTLARREDLFSSADIHQEFCTQMYDWYLDEAHRQQLVTAIYLYVYLYRK